MEPLGRSLHAFVSTGSGRLPRRGRCYTLFSARRVVSFARRRLSSIGVELPTGNVTLHDKAEGVGIHQREELSPAQSAVMAGTLIATIGEGEGLLLPRQQRDTVANRSNQNRGLLEPGKIRIAGEILGKLLDAT